MKKIIPVFHWAFPRMAPKKPKLAKPSWKFAQIPNGSIFVNNTFYLVFQSPCLINYCPLQVKYILATSSKRRWRFKVQHSHHRSQQHCGHHQLFQQHRKYYLHQKSNNFQSHKCCNRQNFHQSHYHNPMLQQGTGADCYAKNRKNLNQKD